MYKNLIEEAKNEGIEQGVVETIIQNDSGKILLIEDLEAERSLYGLPSADIMRGETIPQTLQRAITLQTAMQLKEVKTYLGHYDKNGVRHYHFVTEVKDPYSLEENTKIAYAWLNIEDTTGYPITDSLRDMLDLYAKLVSISKNKNTNSS